MLPVWKGGTESWLLGGLRVANVFNSQLIQNPLNNALFP